MLSAPVAAAAAAAAAAAGAAGQDPTEQANKHAARAARAASPHGCSASRGKLACSMVLEWSTEARIKAKEGKATPRSSALPESTTAQPSPAQPAA